MLMHAGSSRRPSLARVLWLLALVGPLLACGAVRSGLAAERPRSARCSELIPDLFDRVSPAIVSIAATSINPYQLSERVEHITGSGIIIDPSGLVLTNSHVAFDRQSITVTLDDGTSLPATLVGADPIFDLAVLRLSKPPAGRVPAARLGDSDRVRVGEEVLAIGNPLGLDQTLTRGIVSGINRILPETPMSRHEPLIQTDTPINPGSSGGALLNRCGEVIGITTAILSDARSIGFAIPINLVKAAVPSLIARGHVVRPWIGFHGQLVPETLRALLQIPLVEGLLVEVIEPGSPAERAGLRGGDLELVVAGREFLVGGDIVRSVNGRQIDSPETLFEAMRGLAVGQTVTLRVFRDGKDRVVEYALPERPLLPGDIPERATVAPFDGADTRPVAPRGTPPDTW